MRDYKKHLTLLPHKWQAWALFAAVVLAVVYYVGVFYNTRLFYNDTSLGLSPSYFTRIYLWGIVSCLDTIALMIACLSKEKVEDEYIISVRYRALTITVLLFFIIRVISEMMYGSLHNMVFHPMFVGYAFEGQFFGAVAFRKTLNVIHVLESTNVLMFLYIILLKVLVRNGSGNGYKSILLPNSYKRIGWYIFMGSLVFIPLFIYLFCHIWNGHLSVYQVYETHLTLFRLLILIPYVGLLFICLSKEKQEDELIRHIRVRVMVSFAIFYLIIGVLSSFANIAMEVYKLYPHDNEAYFFMIAVLLLRVVLWFPLVSVVYALVLRKVLSNNLKESGNEE